MVLCVLCYLIVQGVQKVQDKKRQKKLLKLHEEGSQAQLVKSEIQHQPSTRTEKAELAPPAYHEVIKA